MNRADIIKALSENYIDPQSVRIPIADYSGNPLAPERVAYKITFRSLGYKHKVVYWPNTVGFQGVY